MNEQKICPLLANVPLGAKSDCLGDRCAWWDGLYCCCAVLAAAYSLGREDG